MESTGGIGLLYPLLVVRNDKGSGFDSQLELGPQRIPEQEKFPAIGLFHP